ncbi:35233_t:CDS:1 [Gigaspora margarita]|uniref:35233_t:CDS:1 n=1 Tax=Gigaspora margarita TaxID=4874 RepID=A0ABN7WC11_GIGMA|nr:35233_t:CDS:1 [Gigaspora margarita]
MSQSDRPQISRTNTTQACTNCQRRRQRCEKLSEGDTNGTCAYCRNNNFHCENTSPKKRGRKPRSPGTAKVHCSFETIVSFIGQEQMQDDQNIESINSYESSFRTAEAQNNDSSIINSYQNITLSSTINLNETSSVEAPLNIYQYGAAETSQNSFYFDHEESAQNNDPSIINPYQNITLSSISHFNDFSSIETPHNVHSCGAAEASQNTYPCFHEESAQNNDSYQNVTPSFISYSNASFSLETPDPYTRNNIITSPNIHTYGANEQLFLISSNSFVHEGSMQNDDTLAIDLPQNASYSIVPFIYEEPTQNNDSFIINAYQNVTQSIINHSNDTSSFETPDPYNNFIISPNNYVYGTNEQLFLLPSTSFVHEGSLQNNDSLTIDLSQNTIYLNDSSFFETTNPYNNYYYSY